MKKIIIFLLLAISVVMSVSCGLESRIVGSWTAQITELDEVIETSVTFNEDGTGTMGVVGNDAVPMTYSVRGDVLTVTSMLFETEISTEYSIIFEGDTLILKSDGETLTFTKSE